MLLKAASAAVAGSRGLLSKLDARRTCTFMRLWALRAALQIPHFANALVRDDNPMSCGAALASADEASIPRWFEVAGGEFGSTPVLEPGRDARPPSSFFNGGQER